KAKLQRMARQVGAIRQQTDAKSQKNTTELMRAERSDLAKQQLAAKLSQSGSQSKFEQILQQVLAGNKTATQELAEGLKARFLIKTDAEWEAFFKNVLALDSTEVQSQAQLSKMIEALFRGLYKKPGTDQTLLIADLAMNENGEVSENKFSKLALNDPALQDLFGQLKPGDVIPPALLQKLGQEFEFIKLVNLLQLVVLSEAQKADILKAYRQQHSPEMQRRLEQALLGQREDDAKRERDNQAPFVYAGHVFEKPEQHKGNPKLFMSLFYGVAGITAALILYILARHLF
ncbi:MAG TPA: hypothetical protein VJC18_01455, partial [bacterium]|nr:hypothetical protein [bacterium]